MNATNNHRTIMPFAVIICCACLITGVMIPSGRSLANSDGAMSTINDFAFIAGHWQGEAFGGTCVEVWNAPSGNSMMGMFKLIQNGKIVFYELMIIAEDTAGIALRLKHFNADLTGWETKDDMLTFPFVKLKDDAVIFEGISFHRKSTDTLLVTLTTDHEGVIDTLEFVYSQVKK